MQAEIIMNYIIEQKFALMKEIVQYHDSRIYHTTYYTIKTKCRILCINSKIAHILRLSVE